MEESGQRRAQKEESWRKQGVFQRFEFPSIEEFTILNRRAREEESKIAEKTANATNKEH